VPKITDIQIQKENKGRLSVFLDGEFFCGLDAFTAQKHFLTIGKEISKEKLLEAVFDSEVESAFEKSMRQIETRLKSEKEIRDYLLGKLYSEDVIEACVDRLKRYNYIDDAEFCRQYINSYLSRWGRKKIEFMLKNLVLDRDDLNNILEEFPCQIEVAYKLAIKHIGNKTLDYTQKQKTFAHLMQKGFDSNTIKEALGRINNNE